MSPYLSQAGIFLIQVLFEFYILAVLLRFLFQLARADFYNPISQFLVILTNPPLLPLRRVIPGLFRIGLSDRIQIRFSLLSVITINTDYFRVAVGDCQFHIWSDPGSDFSGKTEIFVKRSRLIEQIIIFLI